MQVWLIARQWELLFAVAMAGELADAWFYCAGFVLGGLGYLVGNAGPLLRGGYLLLISLLLAAIAVAAFSVPLIDQPAMASALRATALGLALKLSLGAAVCALLLLARRAVWVQRT